MNELNEPENGQQADAGAEMPFLDHLEELRWRLIKAISSILITALISFFFSDYILELLLAPFNEAVALQAAESGQTGPPKSSLIFLAPTEGFMIRIKLALFSGLIISLPIVLYQFWQFVAPGLYANEKRHLPRIILFSTAFFLLGASFCYKIVLRYGLNFLLSFQSETLIANISISEYLGFVTLLILTFGIVFEMPVISYFLTRLGMLTPSFMREKRRYAIVGIFVLSAVITPPDVFTQTMLALPLLLLYEASIWVSKFSQPVRSLPQKA